MADEDSSLFYSSPPYDILMNRKGEKPWKPYPPKRSVSLNKADVVKATTSASVKRTSSTATDMDVASTVEPGPAIVSVVPVDVSGRPFARLRNQPKVKAPEQEVASLNGSLVGRVPARYSTILNASNYDLYGVQEHGFAVKQSLNLRGKTPSKDRWIARTSMNLDPYSYEDDHSKTPSRGFGPKLEKMSGKSKPAASFLLCSSRKSIRSSPREPERPYERTPGQRSLTLPMSQPSIMLSNKWQRLSSEKATRDPVCNPRSSDNVRESDKKKKPRPNSTDLSQGQTLPIVSESVANHGHDAANGKTRFISDHEPFFVSVAVPSGHSFWMTAKTRKSVPVSVPRLSENDLTVSTSTWDPKSRKGAAEAFTVMRLEEASRVPCSLQVISETGCDARFGGVSAPGAKIQALPGRKFESSNEVSKARYQPQYLPSPLDLKEQEKAALSSALTVRHFPTNLGSQTKQSFPSISKDMQEAFDKARHEPYEAKHGGFEKVEDGMQRLSVTSDFASDDDRLNFSFPHPDRASVRSSTISDWYSAQDCHSSSICMDSLGSDPVSLDCASSKGSTTLFSRVKRAIVQSFGAVWTMLLPTSTRPHMSPAPDSLSDVDSGCSFGTNIDLGVLQRSPSEMSEIQKLAALAEQIAADKDRDREVSAEPNSNGSSPSRRRLAHAFSSELETILARSASLSGTRSSSKSADKHMHLLSSCHPSSSDSCGTRADKGWETSYRRETPYLTLPLSSNRNSRDFELPHNPLQQTCNHFSTTRPFVSSLKVQCGCGEIENKTFNPAIDDVNRVKSPNVTYMRNDVAESNPKESSKQFSTINKVTNGGKLSCPGNLLPFSTPGTHLDISCNTETQRAYTGSRPCTRSSSDIKLPNKTVARTALNDSQAGTSYRAVDFTSMQLFQENVAKAPKNVEQCVNNQLNMNLPSSKIHAESLLMNSDKGIKSNALISASQEQHLISKISTQKSVITSSAEHSRAFSNSGRGTHPDEQLSFVQFSVSPELDQAIEMLAASSRRIESDRSPNCSASCITTSTSKEACSREKSLNDVYVSPEDLHKILEQSNFCSDISPKVEASLATQTAKTQGQCFESRRGMSDTGSVLNPKSCSLNDSKIQVIVGNQNRNAHLSQNTSTAENSINLNKTDTQIRYSQKQFGRNQVMTKMSPTKPNSSAVLPVLIPDMENNYGRNRKMFGDFCTGGSKFNNSAAGLGKVVQMGSCYGSKSQEQSTKPQTINFVPNTHKAGLVLGKASGTSTAPNQSAQSSVNNLGRKSGNVSASPSAQRTWASRAAFLSGESS